MQKNIAVVCATFPPYRGGMGNVAYHLSNTLSQLGYRISVFTLRKKTTQQYVDVPYAVTHLRPLLWYGNAGFIPQLFFLLFSFNTVHLHFPFFGGGEMVLLKKILFPKTRLILHYHFDAVGTHWTKIIFRIYRALFYTFYFKYADSIVYTTKDYMEHSYTYTLAKKYIKKVTFIPCGVQFRHFAMPRRTEALRKRLGIPHEAFIGLFVGALDYSHYFKGFTNLLEALHRIRNSLSPHSFTLVVVGSGPLLASYHGKALSWGISSIVHFVGSVTDDDLPFFYQLADVTILPSIDSSEAFGMVLIESMASGTPVIATRLPGVRDVVDEGTGLLTKPGDVGELAEVLLHSIKRAGDIRSTHEDIKAYAKQFDWKIVTEKIAVLL